MKGRQTQRNKLEVEQGKEQESTDEIHVDRFEGKKNPKKQPLVVSGKRDRTLETEKVREKWEAGSRSRWEHRKTEIIWVSRVQEFVHMPYDAFLK